MNAFGGELIGTALLVPTKCARNSASKVVMPDSTASSLAFTQRQSARHFDRQACSHSRYASCSHRWFLRVGVNHKRFSLRSGSGNRNFTILPFATKQITADLSLVM